MLLSVPSIKTISRSLTLVVLQISALHGVHACRQNASRTPAHLLTFYFILKKIYFNIGFKLNGNFFSTYDS